MEVGQGESGYLISIQLVYIYWPLGDPLAEHQECPVTEYLGSSCGSQRSTKHDSGSSGESNGAKERNCWSLTL